VKGLFRGTGPFSWTANSVHGTEQDGIVYYTYHGASYTVDDAGSRRSGSRTVYVIPSKPGDAELMVTGTRIVDWTTTGGPLLVAAGFLTWGFTRKSRNSRRRASASQSGPSFGEGLDRQAVRQLLAQQKASGQQRAVPPSHTPDN
jgi:hypothetical protein